MSDNFVSVRVWGDFACFTRPEMKVERVSYPVMTPSAARGILEAIFWEPQMFYLVDSIRVVKRGRWVSFRRNEVTAVISLRNAALWMEAPEKFSPIQAGGGADDGTQRNTLALEGVEYIVTAEVRLTEVGRRSGNQLQKYLQEIANRARRGKCFHRPALGVREFAADFDWEPDPAAAHDRRAVEIGVDRRAIWPDEDLGLMLYDVFDHEKRAAGFRWLGPAEVDRRERGARGAAFEGALIAPSASFFHAQVREAVLDCHPDRVRLVRGPSEED
jgi:CRISPR-associated protein Cas5d